MVMDFHFLNALECIGQFGGVAWRADGGSHGFDQFVKLSLVFYLVPFKDIHQIYALVQVSQVVRLLLFSVEGENKGQSPVSVILLP